MPICDTSIFCTKDQECCSFPDCDQVFTETLCRPCREGFVVSWRLTSSITDDGPFQFTLQKQIGPSKWVAASCGEGVCTLTDRHGHTPGTHNFVAYRIRLVTGERVYFSRPISPYAHLGFVPTRVIAAQMRSELVNLGVYGVKGYILKRIVYGKRCPKCTDWNTNEAKDANCPCCFGTGFDKGYWSDQECYTLRFPEKGQDATFKQVVQNRGTFHISQIGVEGIADIDLHTGDVWHNILNGDRWYIAQVVNALERQSVPIKYSLGMELIPYSSAIYNWSPSMPAHTHHFHHQEEIRFPAGDQRYVVFVIEFPADGGTFTLYDENNEVLLEKESNDIDSNSATTTVRFFLESQETADLHGTYRFKLRASNGDQHITVIPAGRFIVFQA